MENRFEIFADYFQFYLQDDDIRLTETPHDWNEQAIERMLVTGPHLIGVGTARNMTVPVTVRICEARPTSSASTNAPSRSTPAASRSPAARTISRMPRVSTSRRTHITR
jgi:hypothetical protein